VDYCSVRILKGVFQRFLKLDNPDNEKMRISHESIYQYIWTDKQNGGKLWKYLWQSHKKKGKVQ